MYWEGGALPLTLSGQPCSSTMRSHITFGVSRRRPAIHPVRNAARTRPVAPVSEDGGASRRRQQCHA